MNSNKVVILFSVVSRDPYCFKIAICSQNDDDDIENGKVLISVCSLFCVYKQSHQLIVSQHHMTHVISTTFVSSGLLFIIGVTMTSEQID